MIVHGLLAAFLLLGAHHVHGLLAWVALAPLARAVRHATNWRRAAALSAMFALIAGLGRHGAWVATTTQTYFGVPWPAAMALTTGLALVVTVPAGALLGIALRLAARTAAAPLAMAAIWVAWESLTAGIFPHYPWITLAVTQVDLPCVVQAASLGGQPLLSFAIAAVGASLTYATERRVYLYGSIAMGLALAGYGAVRLAAAESGTSACTVAAIDAAVSNEEDSSAALVRYAALSREAGAVEPDIILWPESALRQPPETSPALRDQLRALAAEVGAPLLVGGPRVTWDPSWQAVVRNSAFLVTPEGGLQSYDKRALVPFAEYWPLPGVPRPAWLNADEVASGTAPGLFTSRACRVGVLICFEAERSTFARELRRLGASALVVLSNDAQLPAPAMAIEVAVAQLRALETGLPVVRVANRGRSAIIDPYGRVRVARSHGALVDALPSPAAAPATALAPVILGLCWLVSAGLVARVGWGYFVRKGL